MMRQDVNESTVTASASEMSNKPSLHRQLCVHTTEASIGQSWKTVNKLGINCEGYLQYGLYFYCSPLFSLPNEFD